MVPNFKSSKNILFFIIVNFFVFTVYLYDLILGVPDVPILPAATAIQNPQAAQLQNRILSILNTSLSSNTPVESNQPEKDSSSILKEPTVQKALESLFQGGTLPRK